MYYIYWDSEDARFNYYDKTYWHSIKEAKDKIKNEALFNRAKLYQDWKNDTDTLSFEEWVTSCIEDFLYYITVSPIDF